MAGVPENQPQLSDESSESTISHQEAESVNPNTPAITNALNYLYSVKVAFGATSEDYLDFMELMKDFKAKRITIPIVTSRVKILFAEHQELLEGFNQFLPAEHKIYVPLSRKSDFTFEEAMSYVNRVKAASPQDKGLYASFLKLLSAYRNANMSITELVGKMCTLLQDRQDLLDDFFEFLPNTELSMTQNAVGNARQDETTVKMKKSSMLLYLFAIALSVLVAIGMGIGLGIHLTKAEDSI